MTPPGGPGPDDAHRDTRHIVERRLAGHEPAAGHDTAGLPWSGREVSTSPFAGDTGAADPRLAAALRGGTDDAELVAAVAPARLLVAVVAIPTEVASSEATVLDADSHSDMATVVLTAPDGERALPAFTSVDAMAAWDPAARPVPVTAADAARAAIEERCSVLVLDVANPHRRVVRSSQLWALAQERPWQHAADDPVVGGALRRFAGGRRDVAAVDLAPAAHGSLGVTLSLSPGLTAAQVEQVTGALAAALAEDDVRIRVDGVALTIRSA